MKRNVTGKKARYIVAVSILILILTELLTLTGCLFSRSPSNGKTLANYFEESAVVAARYYCKESDGSYFVEELPEDRLKEFISAIESIDFSTYRFHTDYYWDGRFGIELELENGNFVTFDGTKLSLRSASRLSEESETVRSVFAEVKDLDFLKEMARFFPSIESNSSQLP